MAKMGYKSDRQVKEHLSHMKHGTLAEEAKETPAFEKAEERIGHYHLGKRRKQAISKYKAHHSMSRGVK